MEGVQTITCDSMLELKKKLSNMGLRRKEANKQREWGKEIWSKMAELDFSNYVREKISG